MLSGREGFIEFETKMKSRYASILVNIGCPEFINNEVEIAFSSQYVILTLLFTPRFLKMFSSLRIIPEGSSIVKTEVGGKNTTSQFTTSTPPVLISIVKSRSIEARSSTILETSLASSSQPLDATGYLSTTRSTAIPKIDVGTVPISTKAFSILSEP